MAFSNETFGAAVAYTNKKIDGTLTEGIAEAVEEQAPAMVGDYCEEHFSEWEGALDDTFTQPTMAAKSSAVGTALSNLSNALTSLGNATAQLVTPLNMFNKNDADIISGKYLDESGVEHDSSTYNESGWIKVEPNTKYTIGTGDISKVARFLTEYTFAKSVVASSGGQNVTTFTTTATTEYIRFAFFVSHVDLYRMNLGETLLPYSAWFAPYYVQKVDKTLEESGVAADAETVGDKFADISDGVSSNSVAYTLPTYQDHEMGLDGAVGGSSSYKHSEKLSVKEGDVVFLYADGMGYSVFNNHTIVMRFVTAFSGDTAISAKGGNAVGIYTVPEGIDGIVVSVYVSNISTYTNLYVGINTPYMETIVKGNNILAGKKWAACGDSFTETGYSTADGVALKDYMYADGRYLGKYITYPQIIGLRNNMNVVNLARSGMTMTDIDGSYENSFTHGGDNAVYKQIPNDADYITIKLGINDLNHNAPLGTIDSTDITTFYGAYNTALSWIVTHHPFAKVGVIVTNGTSANTDYVDAIKAVAKKWGVPYLDEYYDEKIPLLHRANRPGVTADVLTYKIEQFRVSVSNTHPNTKAHYYEASFVEDWLRRL